MLDAHVIAYRTHLARTIARLMAAPIPAYTGYRPCALMAA